MKKFFSMFIAIMCLCTCMVYAEDSKSTEVTFTVGQSFDWTVPANLTLSEGTPNSNAIAVNKNVIPQGAKLVIKLSDSNSFTLSSNEGATRTYTITKDSTTVNAGDTIMEVAAGGTGSQDLKFSIVSLASGKKSGTFKGTASFIASVEVPTPSVSVTKGQIVTLSDLGLANVDLGSTTTTGGSDSTTDTFRVLSVDGSNVTLLAMDVYKSAYFGSNNTYSGSTLDNEMTNYYNALPENVKSAIVAQNIVQSVYSPSDPLTLSDKTGANPVGERYVYALDVDDVIEYLGDNYTASPCAALNQMFFGDDAGNRVSRDVWLRSADADFTDNAFSVYGYGGGVGNYLVVDNEYEVRPAFILNLG